MKRTLLAVHAHPDDEALGTGGVFLRCKAEGIRTVLVMCTRGECGEISDPALATPETLRKVRSRELEEAVGILGVDRLVYLDYRDSGMAGTPQNEDPTCFHQADLAEATERLLAIVREERPQVIVSYDDRGTYGHPDHIKAHQIALGAFSALADESWGPRKLYFTAFPRSRAERMAAMATEYGLRGPWSSGTEEERRERMERFTTPDELVTTEIEIGPWADQKRAAVLAHATQMGPESMIRKVPAEVYRAHWTHEYFVRAAGPASEGPGERERDLFAGL